MSIEVRQVIIIIIIINAKYLTRQTSDSINVRITDVVDRIMYGLSKGENDFDLK